MALFFVVTVAIFAAAIAVAQYPKTVRMEPLVMTGLPPDTAGTSVPRSTLPFPKFAKLQPLQMTGIPVATTTTVENAAPPPPFQPKFIKMDPLVMTGIPTTTGDVK